MRVTADLICFLSALTFILTSQVTWLANDTLLSEHHQLILSLLVTRDQTKRDFARTFQLVQVGGV